ncbi:Ig-like domain-containing protein [Psychrosphaera aestuarii]|uniref:Ig-like domain-containing protein n=1 Tax=Psychrosphaera aestuarii TaxID=1266052 RepID=UPI001B340DAA|nr:hypothetical protein [Psychrosphaera aestuarii]
MWYSVKSKFCLLIVLSGLFLVGCSSGDSNDEPTDTDTTISFSVAVSPVDFQLSVGQEVQLSYAITADTALTVQPSLVAQPSLGQVSFNTADQTITVSAGQTAGTEQFNISFTSGDIVEVIAITFTVNDSTDSDGDGGTDNGSDETIIYQVTWPTDYITLFEDEVIAININRNYSLGNDVVENFYLNAANLNGQLSQDDSQYLISADEAEQDTYGELLAVSEYNGVVTERAMQIIYYNKNRNLETLEPPVIALIEPSMELDLYQSKTLKFDIYDPDSDRIAYRVLSAPSSVSSHVNKAEYGYELTVSLNEPLTNASETLVLEVSDGHLKDQIDIELTQSNNNNSENDAPVLRIEENVTLSLIKKLTGNETDKIAQFAYNLSDETPDFVDLSFSSTQSDFTITNNYPYFSIFADDVSSLQYEQITLSAKDAGFETKLTFHLYIKDNFLSFLGGNPNLAPLFDVPVIPPLLESKSYTFSILVEDFESHPYNISLVADDSELTYSVEGDSITINAALLATPDDLITEFDIVVTDVFGSDRIETVPLTIYKNTPPTIELDTSAIDVVETGTLEIALSVNDVDEGALTPQLIYDTSKMQATFSEGVLSITAFELTEAFTDNFIIRAEDEFGEVTELEVPLIIRTDNSAPVITFSESQIEIAPGQSASLLVNYFDPDGTALTITRFTNNALLTESYDQNTGILTLSLDASAAFQQTMTFTTTASDGFITVSETLTVIVPVAPSPPELTINVFTPEVDEEETLIINFIKSDQNGDNVMITVADGGTLNFDTLNVTVFDNYLRIEAPDNVNNDTNYSIEVTATDDSSAALSTREVIQFVVTPVNDAPEIGLDSNTILLTNDYSTRIDLNITDVDNLPADFTVELLAGNGNAIPNTLEIVGLDVYSLRLKAASKGITMVDQPLKLRVFDGQTYAEETILVTTVLQNSPPDFGSSIDSAQVLEDYTDFFDIMTNDADSSTDGDIVTIKKINVGNVSGANPTIVTTIDGVTVETQTGVGVTITQIEQFIANNRIHVQTDLGSGGSNVTLSIIATDGYVDAIHSLQLKIVTP